MLKDIAQITEEIHLHETGEVEIKYYNLHGETKTLNMCPGDLYIICNVLHDYVSLLKEFIECAEERKEYVQAFYEYHAARCKKIQHHIEEAMDYSTEEAIIKCRKKRGKKQEDDVGEDPLVIMAKRRAAHVSKEQEKKSTETNKN